jgi:hypothetical protein
MFHSKNPNEKYVKNRTFGHAFSATNGLVVSSAFGRSSASALGEFTAVPSYSFSKCVGFNPVKRGRAAAEQTKAQAHIGESNLGLVGPYFVFCGASVFGQSSGDSLASFHFY